jgi:hypothetical protein
MDSNQIVDEPTPTPDAPADAAPVPPAAEPPVEAVAPADPLPDAVTPDAPNDAGEPAESTATSAPGDENAAETFDAAALAALAEQAAGKRLPAADEARATQLITSGLLAGKDAVQVVAAALPAIGWTAGVKGVSAAWPQIKAATRTSFLKAVSADESEPARRIRLSLARGLFPLDPAVCTKLAIGVAKEVRDKKTGEVAPKDAQIFAAVMIGKGKPWISQMPLGDQKPADADAIIHSAVLAAFTTNNPPVTQLGVLKWASEAGRLGELHETALAAITKAVARWSPRWASAARAEIANLPEAIAAALKPDGYMQSESEPVNSGLPPELENASDDEMTPAEDGGEPTPEGEATRPKERPVYVSKTLPPREQRDSRQREPREPRESRESRDPRDQQPQAPREPQPRGIGPKAMAFNYADALRQLESHIVWLKTELLAAEKRSRAREERPRKPDVPIIEGEPTPEELARLNVQLESRITELQTRIDDLTADAEARATSRGAFGDGPTPDAGEQLRTLLGMKLRECFEDFSALEKEDRDLVVPQHYRTVLAEVFGVLKAEGVPLEEKAPE